MRPTPFSLWSLTMDLRPCALEIVVVKLLKILTMGEQNHIKTLMKAKDKIWCPHVMSKQRLLISTTYK